MRLYRGLSWELVFLFLWGAVGCSSDEERRPPPSETRADAAIEEMPRLQFPVRGVLGTDFFYSNYVDHNVSEGIVQDSNCGIKTYDGHQGTDIAISDFDAMDQGVEVLAAADGIVTRTHDGEFDRQKEWLTPEPKVNRVEIKHKGGLSTQYLHLKKDSVAVQVGDMVRMGDVLGLVGSSGLSTFPHLHFATYINGAIVDPFSGACNPGPSLWSIEDEYETNFRVWASGITTNPDLSFNILKDPPPQESDVTISKDRVTFWVHVLNAQAEQDYRFRFIRPDGIQYAAYDVNNQSYRAHTWFWGFNTVAPMSEFPGEWKAEFVYQGEVLASSTFLLH